jgi:hypothetical protein
MKNNNLNLINLLPFYKKETKKTKDNKTNISKINLLKQNNLNTNPISNNKKLNLYLKGLIIYIKNINSYTLKWNNKNLILNLKKNLPQIELPLSHLNKNIIIDTSNKEQLRIESIRLIYNYLNKNLPSFKSNAITNVDIKLLNNKIDEQSSNSLITNKENTILNNEITIPENNNIQKFFKNIELMTKERLKENKNLIINNKKLNSNTESLYPQIIKTTNIRDYLKSITIFNNNISKGKELKFYQEKSYNFNNLNNKLIKKMYDFLQNSFITMNSLISKPLLDITPNKIIIHLFFYHFNIKNTYFKSR